MADDQKKQQQKPQRRIVIVPQFIDIQDQLLRVHIWDGKKGIPNVPFTVEVNNQPVIGDFETDGEGVEQVRVPFPVDFKQRVTVSIDSPVGSRVRVFEEGVTHAYRDVELVAKVTTHGNGVYSVYYTLRDPVTNLGVPGTIFFSGGDDFDIKLPGQDWEVVRKLDGKSVDLPATGMKITLRYTKINKTSELDIHVPGFPLRTLSDHKLVGPPEGPVKPPSRGATASEILFKDFF